MSTENKTNVKPVLGRLMDELMLVDSPAAPAATEKKPEVNDEVIIRKTVKETVNDEITVNLKGDTLAEGDEVMKGEAPAADGSYMVEAENENDEVYFDVVDGKVYKIHDVGNKKIKGGKLVKLSAAQLRNKRKARGGLTPAQYRSRIMSLKKARRKAHSGTAARKRAKSMVVRKRLIHAGASDAVNLENIGNRISTLIMQRIVDTYDVSDEMRADVEEILAETCNPTMDNGKIKMEVPVWGKGNEIDLMDYSKEEVEIEIDETNGKLSEDEIVDSLVDDAQILDKIIEG